MNFNLRTDKFAKIQNIVTEWQGFISVKTIKKRRPLF